MGTAHIIYDNYLSPNGEKMSLGGIQTYLTNLSCVLKTAGYDKIIIYQRGDINFHKLLDNGLEVYGFARPVEKVRGLKKLLFNKAVDFMNPKHDLLIFGSDSSIVNTKIAIRTIAIQHGISWDVPEYGLSRINYIYEYIKKIYRAIRLSRHIKYVDHLVCVDCNFINWYKALVPCPEMTLHYIPNFSKIPDSCCKKPSISDGINIIFARRFFPKRGTRLFMNVAKRLLDEYNNVNITIAGEGPDEYLLRSQLGKYKSVQFIKYDSQDSLAIHANQHIAVIPTLGSEGTSLSLLEAMASGCAVICTNVGGMTNIVINGYNGVMIAPDENHLYMSIKSLIENDNYRKLIAQRGKETVAQSFTLEIWKKAWLDLILNL